MQFWVVLARVALHKAGVPAKLMVLSAVGQVVGNILPIVQAVYLVDLVNSLRWVFLVPPVYEPGFKFTACVAQALMFFLKSERKLSLWRVDRPVFAPCCGDCGVPRRGGFTHLGVVNNPNIRLVGYIIGVEAPVFIAFFFAGINPELKYPGLGIKLIFR